MRPNTATAMVCLLAAALWVPATAEAGCTKDTDCKGDRICEKGECVEPVAPPPRPRTTVFKGSMTELTADGKQTLIPVAYIARTLDPGAKTITEVIHEAGPSGGKQTVTRAVMRVDGNHFVFDATAEFKGDGTLTGPAWKWTGSSAHKTLPDGTVVDTTMALSGDRMTLEGTARTPDGKPKFTMKGNLSRTTSADLEAFEQASGAGGASAPQARCQGGAGWDGARCVCPGGVYNGSGCVCTGGQAWTGNQCACPQGSNWNGVQCSCVGGAVWNGSECACISNQIWNGRECVCPQLSVWRRTECDCVGGSVPAQEGCACPGVSQWNGRECICPFGGVLGAFGCP